jgi:hypothetical protein
MLTLNEQRNLRLRSVAMIQQTPYSFKLFLFEPRIFLAPRCRDGGRSGYFMLPKRERSQVAGLRFRDGLSR